MSLPYIIHKIVCVEIKKEKEDKKYKERKQKSKCILYCNLINLLSSNENLINCYKNKCNK